MTVPVDPGVRNTVERSSFGIPGIGPQSVVLDAVARRVHPRADVPLVGWRISKVTARDPAALTISVELDGAGQPSRAGVVIGNPAYYPRVGDLALIAQSGSDYIAMGAVVSQAAPDSGKVGHVRVRAATHGTLAGGLVENTLDWDTPEHDTDDLWSTTVGDSILTIPWPGVWLVTGNVTVTGGTAVVRRLASLRLNRSGALSFFDRHEQEAPSLFGNQTWKLATTKDFQAGDQLELIFSHGGAGALTVVTGNEYTPRMTATWQGY
jgi:hypothetical protein